MLSRRAFLRRFAGEGLVEEIEYAAAQDAGESADDETLLEGLRSLGLSVSLIGGDSDKLRVRGAGKSFTDERMKRFEPLAGRIVWLDLGETGVGDEGLVVVARMTGLRRLYLQNTQVTDEGLVHLSGLNALHYLNLYGTDVSDDGLQHLKGIASLRRLFLWQTRATAAGAEALVATLPELEVNMGAA